MTLLTTAPHYSLQVVPGDADGLRDVLRLRHEVFAGELGARLTGPAPGLDGDELDELCDHLVVREDATGEVAGCYRLLPPERARGRLYADGEFDLRALDGLRPALVEAGRSCVHPRHRTGAVMSLLWAGIARYLLLSGHRWLAGCASVPLADGGVRARAVWAQVSARHLAPPEHRVTPRRPWDVTAAPAGRAALPPLLRGYLRLGARVCGPPAHDPEFGVADFLVLLAMDDVDPRYLRFFLGGAVPGPAGEAR